MAIASLNPPPLAFPPITIAAFAPEPEVAPVPITMLFWLAPGATAEEPMQMLLAPEPVTALGPKATLVAPPVAALVPTAKVVANPPVDEPDPKFSLLAPAPGTLMPVEKTAPDALKVATVARDCCVLPVVKTVGALMVTLEFALAPVPKPAFMKTLPPATSVFNAADPPWMVIPPPPPPVRVPEPTLARPPVPAVI